MKVDKIELVKALKWFSGDRYYDLTKDYLNLLADERKLKKIIDSYRYFNQPTY